MLADPERVILRVNPERVIAQRLEHRVPLEPLKSSMDVVPREREEVTDVQTLRGRVREHHELKERSIAVREIRLIRAALAPPSLPFRLDGRRIVVDWSAHGSGLVRIGCCHVLGSRVPRHQ